MLFSNARIFTPEGYIPGGFRVEGGVFAALYPGMREGGADLQGAKVLPGLVDIHIHGAVGEDVSDGDAPGLERMARYLASRGVTAFLPTVMTLPYTRIERALGAVKRARREDPGDGARILGARLEGPFLSRTRCGAQESAWLREPDAAFAARLWEGVRIVDLAPELPGALELIRRTPPRLISLGHTAADYDAAAAAFAAGARHVTLLFNAMEPFHHRRPGLIGAAAERQDVTAELISDGIHVHPSAVRLAFRLFAGRLCLVSDALRCCGLGEGRYSLTGREVEVRDGAAYLPDGTLAGSATDLLEALRRAARFGVGEEQAIRAATITPARVLGEEKRLGSIEEGKAADFLVCSEDLSLREVYLAGRRIV